MPVYVYACSNCGHRFEQQQSFTDDSLTICPECSGALRKVFNSVGIVFKGSGFYRTDSRSEKSRAGSSGKADSASGDSKPSADSSSGDSKPSAEKSSAGDKSTSDSKGSSGKGSSGKDSGATSPGKKSASAGSSAS